MKRTINEHDFRQAFIDMNRQKNFSYDALTALFYFFEEQEEDSGQEFELDVIAICCEFSEFEDMEDFWDSYDEDQYPTLRSISESTHVIYTTGDSFVIMQF